MWIELNDGGLVNLSKVSFVFKENNCTKFIFHDYESYQDAVIENYNNPEECIARYEQIKKMLIGEK